MASLPSTIAAKGSPFGVANVPSLKALPFMLPTLAARPANRPRASGQVHCEPLEIGKRAVAQSTFMRGAQGDAGRLTRFKCFLPAWRTKAPPVSGFQPGKVEFRYRSGKIVAARLGEPKKCSGHYSANRVAADVLARGVAAAVAKESRHRLDGAELQRLPPPHSGSPPPAAPPPPP